MGLLAISCLYFLETLLSSAQLYANRAVIICAGPAATYRNCPTAATAASKMQMRLGHHKQSKIKAWNGRISALEALGDGLSGKVLAIDGYRVIKIPRGSPRSVKDIEIERQVYRRLARSPSPYITKCYDHENSQGIIMERLDQTLRCRLRQLDRTPNGDDVVKWALQAARGLAFLHERDIVQADVGCHNMLLDSAGNLKLCDFSGCSIDGEDATVCYEPWSQLPSSNMPDKCADVFALGSAIYEMATGHKPHHDLSEHEISRSYEAFRYPKDYPTSRDERLWTIIKSCWAGDYRTAGEVVAHIELIAPQTEWMQKQKRTLTGQTLRHLRSVATILLPQKPTRTKELSAIKDTGRTRCKEIGTFRKCIIFCVRSRQPLCDP